MMATGAAQALEIQGHRGARGVAPENTQAGFREALAIGVHTLELDVGMTADGHVVVHHDATLNPDTTRLDGEWLDPGQRIPLREMTLEQLRRYDVGAIRPGSGYARRFPRQRPSPGERIPTLAEVVALTARLGHQRVSFNVETKIDPRQGNLFAPPEEFARAVIRVLREGAVGERSTIQSFDWRVLGHVRRLAPEIRTGYLSVQRSGWDNVGGGELGDSPWTAEHRVDEHGGSVPRMVKVAGGHVWSPDYRGLRREALEEAHALGLRVVVWTVNAPSDIRRMIRMGVDGVISDYPQRVRKAAEGLGLALP
jgi:glycerophosphoryl diester phosphodiesterase